MWIACTLRASMLTNLHIYECTDMLWTWLLTRKVQKQYLLLITISYFCLSEFWTMPKGLLQVFLFSPQGSWIPHWLSTPTWSEQTLPKALPSALVLTPTHTLLNSAIFCLVHFYHFIYSFSTYNTTNSLVILEIWMYQYCFFYYYYFQNKYEYSFWYSSINKPMLVPKCITYSSIRGSKNIFI